MSEKGQIIAIGGGGFGRNPNERIIEEYILNVSDANIPKVVFIPTASAEDKAYIVNFYACFNVYVFITLTRQCRPFHIYNRIGLNFLL